jgi:methyl-accepting chemotaxis protein
MKNLKIGTRLAISYAAVLALMILLIVVTLSRMSEMNDATDRLVNTSMKNQRNVGEWVKIIEVNSTLGEMIFRALDFDDVKAINERIATSSCWRRPKIDLPCRSKFDPGRGAAFLSSSCG